MARKCHTCDIPIINCMGHVSPSDLLDALDGKLPKEKIREWCGACVSQRTSADYGSQPGLTNSTGGIDAKQI